MHPIEYLLYDLLLKGWYEPMAMRMVEDPQVVQIPRIDSISSSSISYSGGGGGYGISVGGFTWSGHFTWESLPKQVARIGDFCKIHLGKTS